MERFCSLFTATDVIKLTHVSLPSRSFSDVPPCTCLLISKLPLKIRQKANVCSDNSNYPEMKLAEDKTWGTLFNYLGFPFSKIL